MGGKAIPPNIDKVQDLRSDAQFVLVVEKDAAFMRLAEDRFYNKYPCIIITGVGGDMTRPESTDECTRCALTRHRSHVIIHYCKGFSPRCCVVLVEYQSAFERRRIRHELNVDLIVAQVRASPTWPRGSS